MNINSSKDLEKLKSISPGKYNLLLHCKGKRVLEIGCVNHNLIELKAQIKQGLWLFGYIHEFAQKATGIDINKEAVSYLCKRGYDIRIADAQNFKLDETFDLIVVSAVTDHLLNYDGFMESCSKHLQTDGEILIFEDNILSIPVLLYQRLKKGRKLGMHDDITFKPLPFSFDNFAPNYGFQVKETRYIARRSFVKLIASIIPSFIRPDELIYDYFLSILIKK